MTVQALPTSFSVKSGTIFQYTKLSLKSYCYQFIISLSIVKGFLHLTYPVILAYNIKHHGHYYINFVKQLKKRKITHHSRALFILMVVMWITTFNQKILNISELIDVRDVTNVKINPALWFSVNKLQIRK